MGEYAEMYLEGEWEFESQWSKAQIDYTTWVCRDGRRIKLQDMGDGHLERTIAMLKRNGRAQGWIPHLLAEQKRRPLRSHPPSNRQDCC